MRSPVRDGMLAVSVPLLLLCCSSEKSMIHSNDRILFFGDSITELGVKPNGYVTLIAEALHGENDRHVEIIGAGISGNRVPDLQQRLKRDVLSKKPTIVVVYIGVNDVWHWALNNKGTTLGEFESGLKDIISRIRLAGARVVLCTPSVIGEKPDGTNLQDAMLEQYASISRSVAANMDATLCDLRTAFVEYLKLHNTDHKQKDILTYDGVHLNDAGNRLVADEILKILQRQ